MQRNWAVDIAKFIAAILVVAIHTHPFFEMGEYADFFSIQVVCRLAVPFFAVCSGYYLKRNIEEKKQLSPLWHSMRKIGKMYMIYSIIYLLYHLYNWHTNGILSWYYFIGWLKSSIVSASFFHLWYLLALFYALPLFGITCRYVSSRLFPFIFVPLWIIHSISSAYVPAFNEECWFHIHPIFGSSDIFYICLTRIYPLLLAGACLTQIKKEKHLTLFFVICLVAFVVENVFLRNSGCTNHNYILTTLPTSVVTFSWIKSLGKHHTCDYSFVANISLTIYCLHPLVLRLIEPYIDFHLLLFVVVSVLSTMFGVIWLKRNQLKSVICRLKMI